MKTLGISSAIGIVLALVVSLALRAEAAPPPPVIDASGNVRVASPITSTSGRIGVKNASATDPGVLTTAAQSIAGTKTLRDGLVIGASGTKLDASYAVTTAVDFDPVGAGSCAPRVSVAMPGVDFGAPCAVGMSTAPETGLIADAFVTGAGTVGLRACANLGATAVDPASRVYTIRCFKGSP